MAEAKTEDARGHDFADRLDQLVRTGAPEGFTAAERDKLYDALIETTVTTIRQINVLRSQGGVK